MRVFPRDSAVEKMLVMEETAFNAGNADLIPGSGTSSGGGNGYPLQYSCLGGGNSMNRGAWCLQSMGSQKVRHDLTTPPPPHIYAM